MTAFRALLVCAVVAVASCATPPPQAYTGGSALTGHAVGIGNNAAGEACTQQALARAGGAAIFCGSFQHPSGEVRVLGPSGPESAAAQASAGAWRSSLDQRFVCAAPSATTILGNVPAEVLSCTRRIGGWPQVALIASVDGKVYGADGITPALPALERSIAVLSGRSSPEAVSRAPSNALLASRLAAAAFSSGDVGQYEALMAAGLRANQEENFVGAEQAYRAALQVQQKAIGRDNPNTAVTMMRLAVQQANLHHYGEADSLFKQAAALAPRSADPLAVAELHYDQGLGEVDQGHWAEALAQFRQADATYAAKLPPEVLSGEVAAGVRPVNLQPLVSSSIPVLDATQESALIGVIESRRYQGIALRGLGQDAESAAMIRNAQAIATAQDLRQPSLTARLSRSAAATAEAAREEDRAQLGFARSAADFDIAVPGSRPVAETLLLHAASLAASGDTGDALPSCRQAAKLLRQLQIGTSIQLLAPCLDIYQAEAHGTDQRLLSEMFEAAELVQGSVTSQQIAQASARLAAGAHDPHVTDAIRRRQDAALKLADLLRDRELRAAAANGQMPGIDLSRVLQGADLDAAIEKAQAELADSDAALQAAAPQYGQLVQQVVTSDDIMRVLHPDEAFASIVIAPNGTWTFVLRGGHISVGRSTVAAGEIATLVTRIRATAEDPRKPFDVQDDHALYAATLGTQAQALSGVTALIVAPNGPLLAMPFGVLLTGPAAEDHLGDAPWLVKQMSVSHVPAPANFVSLRKLGPATGATPWFGMGDFRPVTLAQADRTFPSANCRQSARLFAGLPPLPATGRELNAARELLGGSPQDELLGAAYTARAVQHAALSNVRVLHFASHALLPSDLACLDQPAIVTSAPAGSPDATGALLTASDVVNIKLDAQLVILSACNTGGGDRTGGESLSGLARAFFYAGARAMIVTHWEIDDRATTFIVATTLKHLREGDGGGPAGSLRLAQLEILHGAASGATAAGLAHPYYWAPFALVGEGGGSTSTRAASASQ